MCTSKVVLFIYNTIYTYYILNFICVIRVYIPNFVQSYKYTHDIYYIVKYYILYSIHINLPY